MGRRKAAGRGELLLLGCRPTAAEISRGRAALTLVPNPGRSTSIGPSVFPRLSRRVLSNPKLKDAVISITELKEAFVLLDKHIPQDLAVFLMIDGVDEFLGDHLEFSNFW